ncbi:MAG: DUF2723 domain-containing protein, partial [candidate division WOR-3 bacterium]
MKGPELDRSVTRSLGQFTWYSALVWLIPVVALAVYLFTLTPTVGLIDSGELAAGCHLLNILHPTGYPLYTVMGRLASLVPVASVVQRVAGLSALLGAAAVGLLLLLLFRLKVGRVAAGVTALVLAFSFPLWSVTVDVEVYALTVVLALLIWLAVQAATDSASPAFLTRTVERKAATSGDRNLLVVAYLCGLALTNHMSAMSVVLGAGFVLMFERSKSLLRRLPWMALLFLLGLSPYLFLVLRARTNPLLAWGNPVNLERLIWHVTGKQYQV